jgi:uncharacterized protein
MAALKSRPLARVLWHAAGVLTLTVPLWIWSGHAGPIAPGLPVAAIGVVCPALAALIVTRIFDGPAGVTAWWSHARPWARLPWAVLMLACALPVAVMLLSVLVQRPDLAGRAQGLAPLALLTFAPLALMGAWLEESGWSALATEALRPSWPLLPAALLIGTLCAMWHLIPLAQVGRSPAWIAWWTLGTLAMRVTLMWLYERAGHHTLAPTLFHAADNLCWQSQLTLGAGFNPEAHGVLMTGVTVLVCAAGTRVRPA